MNNDDDRIKTSLNKTRGPRHTPRKGGDHQQLSDTAFPNLLILAYQLIASYEIKFCIAVCFAVFGSDDQYRTTG